MRKYLPVLIGVLIIFGGSFLVASAAGCNPFVVATGGTGVCAVKSGFIPFGAGTGAIATSTGLSWNTTTNNLAFTYGTTTALTVSGTGYFGTASTTNLTISGTGSTGTNCLQISNQGVVSSTGNACLSSSAGTYSFTPSSYNNIAVSATSSPIWDTYTGPGPGLIASSTFFTQASTTLLTNSGTTWLTSLTDGALGVDAVGKVFKAATSTASCTSGISCTSFGMFGGASSITLATIAANSVLGNLTGATAVPSAVATSSLFTGATGQIGYFSGTGSLIGTSTIFITTGSKVGIGTTTPFTPLLTYATTPPQLETQASGTTGQQDVLWLQADTLSGTPSNGFGPVLTFFNGINAGAGINGRPLASVAAVKDNSTASTGDLLFNVYNNTVLNQALTILFNGNTGVGTTTPGTLFGVNGDGVFAGVVTGRTFNATSTSVASNFPYASTTELTASGNLYSNGNRVPTFKSPGITIATTTTWTATTSQAIGQLPSPFTSQTIQSAQCYTDAGTLNVDIFHTSTHLTLFNASTTQGTVTFSTNNTMTAGEKWYIQAGTPASAPTSLTCAFKLLVTST